MSLSNLIEGELNALRSLKQRPDWHPEKYVYDHEAYVWFGLRQMLDTSSREWREMALVSMFHDIGNIPTTDRKAEDKGGYITSYGHAEKSRVYWDAVAPAFEDTDVRTDVIGWLIENHMDLKFSDRMNESTLHEKKQEAKALADRVWAMGQLFKQADNMLAFFENHNLDYREDVEAGDDHLEPLDRHEEAIGRFEDYVESVINQIRSWEQPAEGKEFVVVRGVPGCGKTTFAEMIAGSNGQVFETDEYFETDDGYDFDPSKLGEAHEWCRSQVEGAMKNGVQTVVLANTSSCVWEFIKYYRMAAEYGYRAHSVVKENRHGSESEHGVPESTCNSMRNRFEIRL